jgi:zinc protease
MALSRFLLGLILGLGLFPTLLKAELFPYPVDRATLSNGLTVFMVRMPSDGLVTYWSIVRTGSRDEVEPGVTGFAHFFEHMMFRGTEKFPAEEYGRIMSAMGASGNAFTSDDLTAYHVSFTRDDLPKVIELESDRFEHLDYSEPDFKTEAGAVYGEFRKGRTSPFYVLREAVHNAAFERHTYKHTTIGFEADIKRMPEQYQYSRSFFRRFYRPDNTVLLVVGDFNPETALKAIRERYSGWQAGYQAPDIPVEPMQTAQRRIDVPFKGQTLPVLSINFKGERFNPDDPVMIAATMMDELVFGETSELYRTLVLQQQRLQSLNAEARGRRRDRERNLGLCQTPPRARSRSGPFGRGSVARAQRIHLGLEFARYGGGSPGSVYCVNRQSERARSVSGSSQSGHAGAGVGGSQTFPRPGT